MAKEQGIWGLGYNFRKGQVIPKAFRQRGLSPPRIGLKTFSIHLRLHRVVTERYITALPASVLRRYRQRFDLKELPAELPKSPYRVAIVTVVAFGIWFGATASADPYKWCAVYNKFGGGRDCGFVTLEQCRTTISGIGGDCKINQFYTGPNEKLAKRTSKRHYD